MTVGLSEPMPRFVAAMLLAAVDRSRRTTAGRWRSVGLGVRVPPPSRRPWYERVAGSGFGRGLSTNSLITRGLGDWDSLVRHMGDRREATGRSPRRRNARVR